MDYTKLDEMGADMNQSENPEAVREDADRILDKLKESELKYRKLFETAQDGILILNAKTGEIHLVSSIVDQSDRVIDAFNLGIDPKDNYLFFMNKNDLTLWSYDLVASQ